MDFLGDVMKIKPLHIYFTAIIVFIAGVIIYTGSNTRKTAGKEISDKIPNEKIHNGMSVPGKEEAPSKENVIEHAKLEMAFLKAELEKNPGDTVKMKEYAAMLGAGHQPKEAIRLYEKILTKDHKRVDILMQLTFLSFNQGDLSNAENYTNKILLINKDNPEANYNLGAIEATKGNKDRARLIWNNVLKRFPDNNVAKLARVSLHKL